VTKRRLSVGLTSTVVLSLLLSGFASSSVEATASSVQLPANYNWRAPYNGNAIGIPGGRFELKYKFSDDSCVFQVATGGSISLYQMNASEAAPKAISSPQSGQRSGQILRGCTSSIEIDRAGWARVHARVEWIDCTTASATDSKNPCLKETTKPNDIGVAKGLNYGLYDVFIKPDGSIGPFRWTPTKSFVNQPTFPVTRWNVESFQGPAVDSFEVSPDTVLVDAPPSNPTDARQASLRWRVFESGGTVVAQADRSQPTVVYVKSAAATAFETFPIAGEVVGLRKDGGVVVDSSTPGNTTQRPLGLWDTKTRIEVTPSGRAIETSQGIVTLPDKQFAPIVASTGAPVASGLDSVFFPFWEYEDIHGPFGIFNVAPLITGTPPELVVRDLEKILFRPTPKSTNNPKGKPTTKRSKKGTKKRR
jgi:hypothetical protein